MVSACTRGGADVAGSYCDEFCQCSGLVRKETTSIEDVSEGAYSIIVNNLHMNVYE